MARSIKQQKKLGLYLNGSTSSVVAPASYIIPSSFSVAFWYKPTIIAANDRIIDQQDSGPANGFTFNLATAGSPQISFAIRNDTTNVANIISTMMKKGEWNFVTATYEVNSVKLFVNGVQQGNTDTAATMTTPTDQLTIGKRSGGSNYARGFIDEVMIFSKVLSETEITNLYLGISTPNSLGSLDIYYKFDELSGTSITDYSGNARNGTNSNAVYFTEQGVRISTKNKSITDLNFAKLTTAVVSVADNSVLRPETTNVFTWTGWIYLYDTSENVLPRICEKTPHFWCFMGDQTNARANQLALEIANTDNSTTEYWGSSRLQSNRWYFVATTFNGTGAGECQHYVNGELEAMTTLLGPYAQIKSTSGNAFLIGNRSTNSRNLSGRISNVRYHNVVLTQAEIQQIMLDVNISRGLVGKWNIDEQSGTSVADSSGNGYNGTITAATWS